jgi:ParB family chromosome partitioning protein
MSAKEANPRLGRGLAALLGDATPAVIPLAGSGVTTIAIELVEPGPFQPRTAMAQQPLDELVASIRAHGILQPLLVRPHPSQPGRFQIIAGERRWRAAQSAGLHEVPALVRTLTDADAMAAALVENLQRQDLNPVEEAEGYRRLIDEFGLTQDALGQAVGKSRPHIANTLRLLNLPPTVLGELRQGSLTAGHARALLAHPDPAKAALAVIARGLNVRQTEALASAAPRETARPAKTADPDTAALEAMLADRLGLKVSITFNGRSGEVRIRYASLDQLDGLLALLGTSSG